MDLQHWQSQFEAWLCNHHTRQDAAHDIFHFRRVWATSRQLMEGQEVDGLVVLTACYFHDIVSLAKNHPDRHRSSVLAAAETRRILIRDFPAFPDSQLAAVCHAIEAHSFSANIAPLTLEAKIVQDADRLEALGAIGLARVFAVSGALGVALFDGEDPFDAPRDKCARFREINSIVAAFQYLKKNYNSTAPVASAHNSHRYPVSRYAFALAR